MVPDGSRPSRRGASVAVLIGVALVPALALAGTWQYADGQIPAPTTTTTTTAPPPPSEELTTGLLSYRRYPGPLAEQAAGAERDAQLQALAQQLAGEFGAGACLAMVAEDGTTLTELAPRVGLIPASNQKLLIAAVALDVLGPTYRFRTELLTDTAPVEGVIAGNVYLVGGGDPLLSTASIPDARPYPAFNTTSADLLADALLLNGVHTIQGELVGDGSRYDDEFRPPSWTAELIRDDPSAAEAADALLLSDGRIDTVGNYGLNPSRAAAAVFVDPLLTTRGITVVGGAANRQRPSDVPLVSLGFVESAPLTDVIVEMLHTSDNTTAEMLLKEIGYQVAGQGTRPAGVDTVRSNLTEWGVPTDGMNVADGSGLSRDNRLACATLTGLLTSSPVADELVRLLPVAGRDGTLADQFVGSPAEGVLRAKTGTLTGVKALTGTMTDAAGDEVAFSMILNGADAEADSVYPRLWDRLAATIGGYRAELDPDLTPFLPR